MFRPPAFDLHVYPLHLVDNDSFVLETNPFSLRLIRSENKKSLPTHPPNLFNLRRFSFPSIEFNFIKTQSSLHDELTCGSPSGCGLSLPLSDLKKLPRDLSSAPATFALVLGGDDPGDGVEAGSAGSPEASRPAKRLHTRVRRIVTYTRHNNKTHPNAFAEVLDSFSFGAGGVPVREDVPDSSPPRTLAPGPSVFLPLVFRALNIEVGPKDI